MRLENWKKPEKNPNGKAAQNRRTSKFNHNLSEGLTFTSRDFSLRVVLLDLGFQSSCVNRFRVFYGIKSKLGLLNQTLVWYDTICDRMISKNLVMKDGELKRCLWSNKSNNSLITVSNF